MSCLKVNFCAAPSSRKSTVCSALESQLKQLQFVADTSKEYARQYINTYGIPKDMYEQLIIMKNQDIRDKAIASVSEIMLSDTPAIASYIFGVRLLQAKMKREGRAKKTLAEYKYLEELHLEGIKKLDWFDLIIVFPPLDSVIQDGTRSETMEDKLIIFEALIGFLNANGTAYEVVSGNTQEKIEICKRIILDRALPRKKECKFSLNCPPPRNV